MTYNCTLLKDLPDLPAGTTFKILREHGKTHVLNHDLFIPGSAIDNPEWVKQELDETCLTELKCKNCGSTKMEIDVRKAPYKYDDGVYYYRKKLIGVCPCGCENDIITFTAYTEVHY